MSNGQHLQTGIPGDPNGGVTAGLLSLASVMIALLGTLGGLYYASTLTGNARTPMAAIYSFAVVFHIAYFACWTTFWYPLVARASVLGLFYIMFTFLVEAVFAMGFIQMTTGGWGLYK